MNESARGIFTDAERLLTTLYQVGAIAQSDLTELLGWTPKRTSRIIVSMNKDQLRIGGLRERLGTRTSGKIRSLTNEGIRVAEVLLGQSLSRPLLRENEARVAAYLAGFVATLPHHQWNYFGPYLLPVQLDWMDLTTGCIERGDELTWLDWISDGASSSVIQNRLDAWRRTLQRMSIMTTGIMHKVLFVCQSQTTAQRVNERLAHVKQGFEIKAVDHEYRGDLELI